MINGIKSTFVWIFFIKSVKDKQVIGLADHTFLNSNLICSKKLLADRQFKTVWKYDGVYRYSATSLARTFQ